MANNITCEVGKGILFPNKYKETENHPDYRGAINIAGIQEELAAWVKKDEGATMPYIRVICDVTKATFRLDIQQKEAGSKRPDYKGNFDYNGEKWEAAGWLGTKEATGMTYVQMKIGKKEAQTAAPAVAPTAFPTWENGGNIYGNPAPAVQPQPQPQTAPANTAYPQGPQIPAPPAPENIDDIPF